MTEPPNNTMIDGSSETRRSIDQTEIEELRRIIIGFERSRIDKLRERLDSPDIRTEEISRILPDAVILRTSRDDRLSRSLGPAVENAIESSIRRNRKILVDALFPIMGPSIRKAVISTIQRMIQSFDKTLEYSLSIQGLKWRLEALRTKKPFGEIVLLHTLVYQVEQIFLIHNRTSLVIQHVVSNNVKIQDPDLVSSMLSAIRDFIHDSFSLDREQNLDTLHIADRTIWIEQGTHALLAAVIRGTPPEGLRSNLCDILDVIHISHGDELENFNGDTTGFETIRPDLEECLESGYKAKEKRISPLFWLLVSAVILVLAAWCFFLIRDHMKVAHYLERLKAEPGILITSSEKHSGTYQIYGLRDPMASAPEELLKEAMLEPGKFMFKMEPYYSSDPVLAIKRVHKILEPPNSVTLAFKDGLLNIEGEALHQWIVRMRASLAAIPAITRYSDEKLIDIDLNDFNVLREKIENKFFLFELGSSEMLPGQEDGLAAFIDDLKELLHKAEALDKNIHIDILGHADSQGTDQTNSLVSRERADKILSMISKEGLETHNFTAAGMGSSEPFTEERTSRDRELNRRVTIRITG